MRKTRFWILLFALLLLASLAALLLLRRAPTGTVATIRQDGQIIREIDLSRVRQEERFTVACAGGSNTVAVRPGAICVESADCPDGVCVRRGWVSGGVEPVVCLPHGLVITFSGGAEQQPDATAG